MVLLSGKNPSSNQSLQQVIDVNDDLNSHTPLSNQVIKYNGTNVVWGDVSSSIIPTLQQVLTQGNTASTNIIINGTHTTTMSNNGLSIDGQTTYSNIGANIKGLIKIESNPNTTISLSGNKGATGNVLVSGGASGNLTWGSVGGLQSLQDVININDALNGSDPSGGKVIKFDGTNVVWGDVSTPTLQAVIDAGDDLSGNPPSGGKVIQFDGTNVVWGDVSTPTLQQVLDTQNTAIQTITLEDTLQEKKTNISDSSIRISNTISSAINTEIIISDTSINFANNNSLDTGSVRMATAPGGMNFIEANSDAPGIFSSVSMGATPLNPDFRLSQTDNNFGESYSLFILKDSITHDCSGVTGPFTISTKTDLTLTSTQNINLDTSGQVFINGTAYPPAIPSLSSVLTAGPTGNNGQTITLTSSSVVGQTVYGSEQLTQTGAIPYSMNTQGDLLITAPNFNTTNSKIIIPNSSATNHTFLDGSGTHVITDNVTQADLYSGYLEIKDLPTTTQSFIAGRYSTTLTNLPYQTNASTATDITITDGSANNVGLFTNSLLQFTDVSGALLYQGVKLSPTELTGYTDLDDPYKPIFTIKNEGTLDLRSDNSIQLYSAKQVNINVGTQMNITGRDINIKNDASLPLYITNTSGTGIPSKLSLKKITKLGQPGDVFATINYEANDASGNNKVFASQNAVIKTATGGTEDASIDFYVKKNGSDTKAFTIDGGEEQINCNLDLDMNSKNITTSSGNITISATGSTGSGDIILIPKEVGTISTLKIPRATNPNDMLVIEKHPNFTDFFQSGGATNTNTQMRLGTGGLRLVTINSDSPNFQLDNESFASAQHKYLGTTYNLNLPNSGKFSLTNGSLDLNGQSIQPSIGDATIDTSTSTGTGDINITSTTTNIPSTGGIINFTSRKQTTPTTNDMVFKTGTTPTLTHSDASGWDFQANNIKTTGDISCNTLYYTSLSPGPSLQSVMDVSYNLQSTAPTISQVIQFDGTNPVWASVPPISTDTLEQVLIAGNTADNFIELTNGSQTNLLQKTSISMTNPISNGTSSFSANGLSITTDDPALSSGGVGLNTTSNSSQIGGGVAGLPSPPYPAPDANYTLYANTSTYNPTLYLSKSAPFTNSTSMTLDLNNLIHNQSTGSPSPDDNFTISTNKNLILTADNIDLSNLRLTMPSLSSSSYMDFNSATGKMALLNSNAGGAASPQLTLTNTNATGSVAMEVYKNKPTAGTNGDVLFNQSVYGKDSGNVKQEYTRISHTIRDATAGAEDGSLEMGCFVNGAYQNFVQFNANDAPIGEVNIFRPLDFVGGSDANNTIKVSGTGSQDLNLTGVSSAGTGHINLTSKTGTVVNVAGNININAVTSTGAGTVNITAKTGANINLNSNVLMDNSETLTIRNNTGLISNSQSSSQIGFTDLTDGTNVKQHIISNTQQQISLQQSAFTYFNEGTSNNVILRETDTTGQDTQRTTLTRNLLEIRDIAFSGIFSQLSYNNLTIHAPYSPDPVQTGYNAITAEAQGTNSGTSYISLGSGENNTGSGRRQQTQITNGDQGGGFNLNWWDPSNLMKSFRMFLQGVGGGFLQFDNSIDANPLTIQSVKTNLKLQTDSSTAGQGDIEFAPSQSANGQIIFTGGSLEDTTSSGSANKYLKIVLNGSSYKIALDNN